VDGSNNNGVDVNWRMYYGSSYKTHTWAINSSGLCTTTFQDNLVTTGNITPSANNSKDLGSSSNRWANVYAGDLHLKNEVGDWTIEEGEEELFIINNKTGKKYAIMMREIE
jgi:hypothetical protein